MKGAKMRVEPKPFT